VTFQTGSDSAWHEILDFCTKSKAVGHHSRRLARLAIVCLLSTQGGCAPAHRTTPEADIRETRRHRSGHPTRLSSLTDTSEEPTLLTGAARDPRKRPQPTDKTAQCPIWTGPPSLTLRSVNASGTAASEISISTQKASM
jgi:hypothetical protein